jgi:hypothetical protein
MNHKQSCGIATCIKTTEEIYQKYPGRDEPEQIKYFIKDAIETQGVKYVLLVGNKNTIPVRYATIYLDDYNTIDQIFHFPIFQQSIHENKLHFLSDLYYADIYDQNHNFSTWDTNNNDVFAEANSMILIDEVNI